MFYTVSFGNSRAGLETVGYQLFDITNSPITDRITERVFDLDDGQYGAEVNDSGLSGYIKWDTGDGTDVVYASSALISGGGNGGVIGSGPYLIIFNTITVHNVGTAPTPIPNVMIRVISVVVPSEQSGVSDTDGVVRFGLAVGSYSVIVAGYPYFASPFNIVVSGDKSIDIKLKPLNVPLNNR